MASAMKRFGGQNEEQIEEKRQKLQKGNTIKQDKKAEKVFKDYLAEIGEDTNFYEFEQEKLDRHLSTFWFNARTTNGDFYKSSSLQALCYGLNRCLNKYGHTFDITKRSCAAFTKSIQSYEDAQKELKREGKGYTKNTRKMSDKHK